MFNNKTRTVRECLQFSVLVRQSQSVPKQEKFAYLEFIIEMLIVEGNIVSTLYLVLWSYKKKK
ncbi:hypothetical protein C8Q69DRAFT_465273 [Paecilomyces variotii]|uniref:Uncharacterized protein n=1 Tax=Byssochlamys spectabilis TaxID=264951 RepID=A0A443HXG0_BYSSP|nr:hypothetical protein C8Q69DRAFT_465273 [Paecilomyces variotii]RWQ96440.1 hypothetical protein C8Q69DRAFT_465273 [Paecilomyces variotii]